MTEVEKKVFINWSDEHIGKTRAVVLSTNRADGEAIWSLLPMPMVLMPWTERAVQWLRPYVEKGWFDSVEIFYLAGPKGSEREPGADMLTQLLGSAKCVVCDWGEYGNAAEAAAKGDDAAIVQGLNNAPEHPYHPLGVVTVDELLPELEAMHRGVNMGRGLELHWGEDFDRHCRFNLGSVAIVVGREGEGKSSWVDELTMRLALIHDLKICIWTPEAKFMTMHSEKLLRLLYQRDGIQNLSDEDFRKGYEFISSHFVYVDFPFPMNYERMTREEQMRYEPTLDNLISRAYHSAESFGARVFVFDPLLLISRTESQQNEKDFARDVINRAKLLAMRYSALVILVTHPHRLTATDLQRSDRPVTTDDIYGSGQYAFMLDYTFAINRIDKDDRHPAAYVLVDIGKVKQQRFGYRGKTFFTFQPRGERFNPTTMRDVETKNGKGTTHIEPAQTYVNPKRWLDKEGRPDLAALEFQLPVNMVNGERLKVNDSNVNHAPGSARRTPLRGENPEPVNHEPSKVNRQLLMDSLLDDAAQNQNPALPD